MKAIIRQAYGDIEHLMIKEVANPIPNDNQILIKVKAFGINRAEIYMRKGLWGDVATISGIECVGTVEQDPSGTLPTGQKVAAIMGGMGRTINGSYAEYVCVPKSNVMPIETTLNWAELAAIPESYLTAYTCLFDNLKLKSKETLAIIGGTSALGQAAINLAVEAGIDVIATTRNKDNIAFLESLGVKKVFINVENLSKQIRIIAPQGIDAVLDIVGNTTLLDSLKMVKKGGTVCNAGFLGGGDPIDFNPLTDMPSGVNLNFFASFLFGTPDFQLSSKILQQIINKAEQNRFNCKPTHQFNFDEIQQAHSVMESNTALGKIAVVL